MKRLFFIIILIIIGLTRMPTANAQEMCCPQGYSTSFWQCPFGIDRDNYCCRRLGYNNYDVKPKIPCDTPHARPAQGGLCCFPGYSTSFWQCPLGTDTDYYCCHRLGLFNYDVKPKISCDIKIPETLPVGVELLEVCDYSGNVEACQRCLLREEGASWTAIGCIPTDPTILLETLLTFGVGIAGGIAFMLIILGGFQIMTSTGNPERLNAGRELINSAMSGLILIIFSVFLLRLIGYDILRIPGFQ